ncbi:MAG: four helix bundle protein [Treponema sp.]|nr:four helix bundle protein [Treponema sp.]
MPTKKSELYVITKAKELAKYVITVTEKSPKKFRFTLVVRLQNYCLDIIEKLLLANMLPLSDLKRLKYQQKAGRLLNLLGYFSMICMESGCILPNQFENISKLQAECLLFLGKWIDSDKKRNKTPSGDMP